jgi:hypothetical protein
MRSSSSFNASAGLRPAVVVSGRSDFGGANDFQDAGQVASWQRITNQSRNGGEDFCERRREPCVSVVPALTPVPRAETGERNAEQGHRCWLGYGLRRCPLREDLKVA